MGIIKHGNRQNDHKFWSVKMRTRRILIRLMAWFCLPFFYINIRNILSFYLFWWIFHFFFNLAQQDTNSLNNLLFLTEYLILNSQKERRMRMEWIMIKSSNYLKIWLKLFVTYDIQHIIFNDNKWEKFRMRKQMYAFKFLICSM